jgi:Cyclophilin type peptidyl-prolyl cis-trans isomerase/CLD
MFDHIANPPKGKGKEKDVGKRRAYVRVVTTLGGGSLNLELFCEKVDLLPSPLNIYPKPYFQAPKTCYNFLMLARAGKYDDCLFHRLVPGFMVHHLSISLFDFTNICHYRSRQVIPRAQALVGSRIGARLFETSTMQKTLQNTTVVELLRWRTEGLARTRSFLTLCSFQSYRHHFTFT